MTYHTCQQQISPLSPSGASAYLTSEIILVINIPFFLSIMLSLVLVLLLHVTVLKLWLKELFSTLSKGTSHAISGRCVSRLKFYVNFMLIPGDAFSSVVDVVHIHSCLRTWIVVIVGHIPLTKSILLVKLLQVYAHMILVYTSEFPKIHLYRVHHTLKIDFTIRWCNIFKLCKSIRYSKLINLLYLIDWII